VSVIDVGVSEQIEDYTRETAARKKGCIVQRESKSELQAFENGATRSAVTERLDLIPREALAALGRRLALGAQKHGENNWRGGGDDFRKATINHLVIHLYDYIENGNATDANTDAIICNAAFLCFFEAKKPLLPAAREGI
jgi:hypothetical protein